MKSNALKLLVLTALMALAAAPAGVARGGRHRGEDRPARREVRAYFDANIRPVLQQQRQKLEPQLSAADRTQLATYRTQLKDLKEQGRTLRRSLRPEGTSRGTAQSALPALTGAQRQQAHQLRFQAQAIMLNVAQLARKYDAPITQLTQEVAPQKEQWTADIKAILAKSDTPSQQPQLATAGGRMRGPGRLGRLFKPAMFLLLDPNAPASGPNERGGANTSFYPNPAAATSQLTYEVKKAGPVTVDLLDKSGNKLRTLVSETSEEKGPHTQQLNLQDLPTGTYFYKITTKSGSETKRFVKE